MGVFDRFILKEILRTTFFAVLILCGVFLMGTLFKEARPLLVGKSPSPWLFVQFIGSVLPLSLSFMLPCSFLAAILITVGRLSSQNELTAMQMSGRSLFRISLPIFVLALLMCGVCYFINTTFAPRAKSTQKSILYEAVQTDPSKFLDPGVVKHQLKDQIVYVERREGDKGDTLYGLHVFDTNPDRLNSHFPLTHIYARKANLIVDDESKQLRLRLYDASIESFNKTGPNNMFFGEKQEPLIFDFSNVKRRSLKVSSMSSNELREAMQSDDPEMNEKFSNSLRNEYYGRFAFSLSCLSLAFVGIPLAISTKRRETSLGFVLAIVVALKYFSYFIVANGKRDEPMDSVQWMYWFPNLLAIAVGCYLFYRAQRK